MIHARLFASLAIVALPLVSGCGGAASVSAGATPSGFDAKSAEELGTVDGATAAVDHAERAIDQLLGPAGASASVAVQAGPPPPPPAAAASAAPVVPAAPSVAPAESSGRRLADKDAREGLRQPGVAADACSIACGALASMERATDHLCGLAGADDARCTAAQARVKNAGARVRAACPVCGGS
jgi:hypothetical protein